MCVCGGGGGGLAVSVGGVSRCVCVCMYTVLPRYLSAVHRLRKMSNADSLTVVRLYTPSERARLELPSATFLLEIGPSKLKL